jgi:hypothetical protein
VGRLKAEEQPRPPLFFVSVAFKGVSFGVSLLFTTLAERFVSVAAKGVRGADCWRESNWVEWEDIEGVRRTGWRARPAEASGMSRKPNRDAKNAQKAHIRGGAQRNCAEQQKDYSTSVQLVKCYFKWSVCREIV